MESKLDRTRRLSKELKKCLDLLKITDSSRSTQTSCRSDNAIRRERLSKTSNSENSLPLLSLSERRRASKQMKQDELKKLLKPGVIPIKEDYREQLATPKLENLRVRPQRAEKSPHDFKYCRPKFSETPQEITKPQARVGLQENSYRKYTPKQGNPFREMFARLVQTSLQELPSLQSVSKVVIQSKIDRPLVTANPRKGIRTSIHGRPLQVVTTRLH